GSSRGRSAARAGELPDRSGNGTSERYRSESRRPLPPGSRGAGRPRPPAKAPPDPGPSGSEKRAPGRDVPRTRSAGIRSDPVRGPKGWRRARDDTLPTDGTNPHNEFTPGTGGGGRRHPFWRDGQCPGPVVERIGSGAGHDHGGEFEWRLVEFEDHASRRGSGLGPS